MGQVGGGVKVRVPGEGSRSGEGSRFGGQGWVKAVVKVGGQGRGVMVRVMISGHKVGGSRSGVKVRGHGQGSGQGEGVKVWRILVRWSAGKIGDKQSVLSRTHDRIEFHSIPFHSNPFHSIPCFTQCPKDLSNQTPL